MTNSRLTATTANSSDTSRSMTRKEFLKFKQTIKQQAKYYVRVTLCVSVCILGIAYVSHAVYNNVGSNYSNDNYNSLHNQVRRLVSNTTEAATEICMPSGKPAQRHGCNDFSGYPPFTKTGLPMAVSPYINGGVILYILGTMYTFMGLAVVCDEYFVPALEAIIEKYEINDDVAGATLMAAGGSAPELATSLIGTFVAKSNVGFGTIVGSAVFNVLFVIGCCAIFSKEVLELTWWPLFRDSIYYIIGLLALYLLFEVSSKNVISTWEALVLFGLYWGYVLIMAYNQQLKKWVNSKLNKNAAAGTNGASGEKASNYVAEGKVAPKEGVPAKAKPVEKEITNIMTRPAHFRAGILHLVLKDQDPHEQVRIKVVAEVIGDVKETFKQIDDDNNGYIDVDEFAALINRVTGNEVTMDMAKEQAQQTITEIDLDGDGHIDFEEFKAWYLASETRVMADVHKAFYELDYTKDGMIELKEFRKVIVSMGMQDFLDDNAIVEALTYFKTNEDPGKPNKISFEQFQAWYKQSMLWEKQQEEGKHDAEREEDGEPLTLEWPESNMGRLTFILWAPIMVPLYFTIPDCRDKKLAAYFPATFSLSIVWVGIYSYLMVWWVTVIGDVFEVPIVIMGLTFLAAGTSVPDLLTSVIVAKQGHGDMAVSSSIGSNIFDILVGLPVPWLLYCIANGGEISVGGGVVREEFFYSVGFSLLLLICMLISVVCVIAASGWKMTKSLGYAMFALYGVFVVVEIIRAYT
jgi:K+-dependent Na+/Ca+ exchanger-like protein